MNFGLGNALQATSRGIIMLMRQMVQQFGVDQHLYRYNRWVLWFAHGPRRLCEEGSYLQAWAINARALHIEVRLLIVQGLGSKLGQE